MGGVSQLWAWVTTPVGPSLGPTAWLVIGGSGLLAFFGAFLAESSEARRHALLAGLGRRISVPSGAGGPGEVGLRTELRVKGGVALAVWAAALILALLLRLFATPGLTTNVLPALVVFALPFLISYYLVYSTSVYPRYLEQARRVDTRKTYEPSGRGGSLRKKASRSASAPPTVPKADISLTSGKTVLFAAASPFVYYFILLPHPSTMHDLHQLGMLVVALIGYTAGLLLSLGDGVRTGSFWVRGRRN